MDLALNTVVQYLSSNGALIKMTQIEVLKDCESYRVSQKSYTLFFLFLFRYY